MQWLKFNNFTANVDESSNTKIENTAPALSSKKEKK